MIIPWKELQHDTLQALAEAFVLREGTDYGQQEVTFDTKVAQILRQLEAGKIEVVFDAETESCDLREVNPFKSKHGQP